jgi:hypothetical protein
VEAVASPSGATSTSFGSAAAIPEMQTPASASHGTPVTMEAMSALLATQLAPITGTVNRLESDFKKFQGKTDGDIQDVKKVSDELKEELEQVKNRICKVEERGEDQMLETRVKGIEQILAELKISPSPCGKDLSTAVVGGLQDASSAEAAKAWVMEIMNKTGIDGFSDVFDKCKGRDFNGMIFIKFSSAAKRDAAIKTFNDTKTMFSEQIKFMSKDLPIKQRTAFSFLINLKKLLLGWGFLNVNFDDDSSTLSVAGVPVLRVTIEGFTFKPVWLESEWAEWNELMKDPKYKELIAIAEGKLAKASHNSTKGKGKANSA